MLSGARNHEPGAISFFRDSHIDTGAQTFGPYTAAFCLPLTGSWVRSGAAEAKSLSIWNASVIGMALHGILQSIPPHAYF